MMRRFHYAASCIVAAILLLNGCGASREREAMIDNQHPKIHALISLIEENRKQAANTEGCVKYAFTCSIRPTGMDIQFDGSDLPDNLPRLQYSILCSQSTISEASVAYVTECILKKRGEDSTIQTFALYWDGKQWMRGLGPPPKLNLSQRLRDLTSSYSEFELVQEFTAGEAQALKPNPQVTLRMLSSRRDGGCEIELRCDRDGENVVKSGKVEVGTYVDFAPELVGTHGLELISLTSRGAKFKIRWGGT